MRVFNTLLWKSGFHFNLFQFRFEGHEFHGNYVCFPKVILPFLLYWFTARKADDVKKIVQVGAKVKKYWPEELN